MSRFLFVLLTVFSTLIGADDDKATNLQCPYVNPVCKCAAIELCKNDSDCPKEQKCCLNCCGGHICMNPVDERCKGEHEVYNSCGSSCPTTCGIRQPRPCILPCKPGCFCKQGYLRNSAGDCVEEEYCS